MRFINPRQRQMNWILCISFVVVAILAISFSTTISKFSMAQNIENRVFAELKSTTTMQASTLRYRLDEQYEPLMLIADMLEAGEPFTGEKVQFTVESLIDTHDLLMIGFADMDGNAVSWTGEQRGNINEHNYFTQIANGSATKYCEYLSFTEMVDEPRILFSIPAYQRGEMTGVLFCSIEVNVLEHALFEHSDLFDAGTIIFVCDSDGNMIVANDTAHAQCIADGGNDKNCHVFEQVPELEQMYRDKIEKKKISFHETGAYVSFISIDVNDWYLGCIVDEATATKAYAANLVNIKKLVNSISAVFVAALGYILVLSYVFLRKIGRESNIIKDYYENYKILLRELNCTVVEYDPAKKRDPFTISIGEDIYGINTWDGSMEAYMRYKDRHPEFDFITLEKDAEYVRSKKQSRSFESIIALENNDVRWIKIILIPNIEEYGNIKIFAIILDVSDIHQEFELSAETFSLIPGGIHRCYLSNPIHVEYFSDGLCKMLGYSRAEVEEIITPDRKYSALIYPEDRPVFRAFVYELLDKGGTKTCEYRMVCKDGTLLAVADAMDVKCNTSGIIYGYSIVTDLHEYKEVQKKLEIELEETQNKLIDARIRNSYSQMQPHFLYNALASIREIVLDDPEYASDLIYDFTTHLRACIRSMSSDNLVSFTQELENIKAYVNIEKMRFGDKLNIQYDCSVTNFDIVPLSIQPLVENAIRHGVYERGFEGGQVIVRTSSVKNGFLVEVEDNGVGFDYQLIMDEVRNGKRDSTGLFNSIFRLEKLLRARVTVESQVGVGTKISITIPGGDKR